MILVILGGQGSTLRLKKGGVSSSFTGRLTGNNSLVPSNWSHVEQIDEISKVCMHHGTCLRFNWLALEHDLRNSLQMGDPAAWKEM